jgi:hypothetical protein
MQKLCISYCRVRFKEHHIQMKACRLLSLLLYIVIPFQGISSDPNGDCMKTLCAQEVDIQTCHFRVHKVVGISYSRDKFMVNYSLRHGVSPFMYFYPW